MKLTQNFIILVFTLFCFNSVSAQYGNSYGNGYGGYGNGYGNGYGSNRMGMDRSMMAGPQGNTSKPKEVPVEETAAKVVEQMKPVVNLDELQAIAVTNVLADTMREQGILLKNENATQDQKIEQIKALTESMNKKINAFLNPDQVEKYTKFMAEFKEIKKTKSKKKKDKDKDKESKDLKEVNENPDTKIQE